MISGPKGNEADRLHPSELAQLEAVVSGTYQELVHRLKEVDTAFLQTDSEAREREAILKEQEPELRTDVTSTATELDEFEARHRGRGIEWWRRAFPSWSRWLSLPVVTGAEGVATYLLLEGLTSSTVTRAIVGLIIGAVLAFTGDQTGGELSEWWRGFRMYRLGLQNHPRPMRMFTALAAVMLIVGLGAGALRASGTLGSSTQSLSEVGITVEEAPADEPLGVGDWAIFFLLGVVPALIGVGVALGAVNELGDAHDELVGSAADAEHALQENSREYEAARRARQRAASRFLVEAKSWPSHVEALISRGREAVFAQRAAETEHFGTSVSQEVIDEIDSRFEHLRELEFPEEHVAYAHTVFNGDLGEHAHKRPPEDPPDLSMVQ